MADLEDKRYFCKKCLKTMARNQFYQSNNKEKYPSDGILDICKGCITMHVDNFDTSTFLWILQEVDVPWVPEEWNTLLAKYAKDPSKVTGATILGRYLAKMHLKQYKDYRWKDNDFLRELAETRARQSMEQQNYDSSEIARNIEKMHYDVPESCSPPALEPEEKSEVAMAANEDYFAEQEENRKKEALALGLTEEDIEMLRTKWGKSYTPEEWISLETFYQEMMDSYDIQTAGHINTLKLACKSNLKANQLLDLGD